MTSLQRSFSLSPRERVAAKRPGEGLRFPSFASPFALPHGQCRARLQPLTRRLRRHPLQGGEGT